MKIFTVSEELATELSGYCPIVTEDNSVYIPDDCYNDLPEDIKTKLTDQPLPEAYFTVALHTLVEVKRVTTEMYSERVLEAANNFKEEYPVAYLDEIEHFIDDFNATERCEELLNDYLTIWHKS